MTGVEEGESGQMVNDHSSKQEETNPRMSAEPIPDLRKLAHQQRHDHASHGTIEAVNDPPADRALKVVCVEQGKAGCTQEKGAESKKAEADGKTQKFALGKFEAEEKGKTEEDIKELDDCQCPGLKIEVRHFPGEILQEEKVFEMGRDQLKERLQDRRGDQKEEIIGGQDTKPSLGKEPEKCTRGRKAIFIDRPEQGLPQEKAAEDEEEFHTQASERAQGEEPGHRREEAIEMVQNNKEGNEGANEIQPEKALFFPLHKKGALTKQKGAKAKPVTRDYSKEDVKTQICDKFK